MPKYDANYFKKQEESNKDYSKQSNNYPYPHYAPWTAVEAGKKAFRDKYKQQDSDND